MNDVDRSSHKLPPQNLEAEQSVLGGILIENEAINRVMEILIPEDFYRDAHRKIFDALIDLLGTRRTRRSHHPDQRAPE